jgi:hypothetical protein
MNHLRLALPSLVIPAKAGIPGGMRGARPTETPAFAGVTIMMGEVPA